MANEEKPKSDPIPASATFDPESDLPPDADVEERFNEFWKKNGTGIFGGIALGAVIVLGVQISDYMGDKKEESTREAYRVAVTMEEKEAFVGEYGDHPLAAMALIEVGDSQFEDENFSAAADSYGKARELFTNASFSGRAQLGQAISLVKSGEVEAGRVLLESLASSMNHLNQIRGEAAYHLAVLHWEAENYDGVRSAVELIEGLENARFWVFQATSLRDRIPELAQGG